jgi:hypothetical protein
VRYGINLEEGWISRYCLEPRVQNGIIQPFEEVSIHVGAVGYEFVKEGARKGRWFHHEANGECKRIGEAKETGREHVACKRTALGGLGIMISHALGEQWIIGLIHRRMGG